MVSGNILASAHGVVGYYHMYQIYVLEMSLQTCFSMFVHIIKSGEAIVNTISRGNILFCVGCSVNRPSSPEKDCCWLH